MASTKTIKLLLNESEDATFRFISDYDATDTTVSLRYRLEGETGSTTEGGSVAGNEANTLTEIDCGFVNLSAGTYDFWVYSGYNTSAQKQLVPNNDEVAKFEIISRP
jgi:hypothetical protein